MFRSGWVREFAGLAVGVTLVLAGCGDDGEPVPGYSHPCSTSMGSLLSCPPRPTRAEPPLGDAEAACSRLVTCGILAAENLVGDSQSHQLDYQWCVTRLQRPGASTDPCDSSRRYSTDEVAATVACVRATPCAALGLAFGKKRRGAPVDTYQCANGNPQTTATVCDHGLLRYP